MNVQFILRKLNKKCSRLIYKTCSRLLALTLLSLSTTVLAAKVPVTVDNYEWAESDLAFHNVVKTVGTNHWRHSPGLVGLDRQTVVRMNRDTVYSAYIADVSEGGSVTIPETEDGRYLSVMVVQNDHYIDQVFTTPGEHKITSQSDFVMIAARIQINADDPSDIENVRKYQSQLAVSTGTKKEHKMPDYDKQQLLALRAKLAKKGSVFGSLRNMQGAHGKVDKQMHLYGTAIGWGLLPDENAVYSSYFSAGEVAKSDRCSKATYLAPKMKEGGFFSITVYDKNGWLVREASVLNNYNIDYNADGTFTAHYGQCPKGTKNHLLVENDWNLIFRIYEPILEKLGKFKLPTPIIVK